MTIYNLVQDGTLLARLQNVSNIYTFAHDFEQLAGTDSISRESVCQLCHGSCNGCSGASNTQCIDCSGDLVQQGNTCLNACPNGTFLDVHDGLCKPSECEFGDVILVADTGAHVMSENSWRYIEKGQISSVTPSSGQATTPVLIQGVDLRAGGDNIVLCR